MARNETTSEPKDLPRVQTRLGADTSLKGTLRFSESVAISGKLEGKIVADGFLYIRQGAEIRADIRARDIIVGGTGMSGPRSSALPTELCSKASVRWCGTPRMSTCLPRR